MNELQAVRRPASGHARLHASRPPPDIAARGEPGSTTMRRTKPDVTIAAVSAGACRPTGSRRPGRTRRCECSTCTVAATRWAPRRRTGASRATSRALPVAWCSTSTTGWHQRRRSRRPSKTPLAAYNWMLQNGPSGPSEAADAFIAGDSAGGGLALATLMALRDAGGRAADRRRYAVCVHRPRSHRGDSRDQGCCQSDYSRQR